MPLRSMTGFGQAEQKTALGIYRVEIRAVNNRFFEMQIRLPRAIASLEQKVKQTISEKILRGSINVFVTCDHEDEKSQLSWDETSVENYIRIFKEIKEKFNLAGDVTLANLLQFSDVIKLNNVTADDKKIWVILQPILDSALQDFQSSREAEAGRLVVDLKKRLKEIRSSLKLVEKRAPVRLKNYREVLSARVEQVLKNPPDPERLAQEVAFMADKLDLAEEITRLAAHIEKFAECFESNDPIGKRMNFLLQEMNREANTIGSKANDIEISHLSVLLKESIEQIREQIQNLE